MSLPGLPAAKIVAARLKRQTRNMEWIELCDFVLEFSSDPAFAQPERKVMPVNPNQIGTSAQMVIPPPSGRQPCPVCAARKRHRREAMRRYRRKLRKRIKANPSQPGEIS